MSIDDDDITLPPSRKSFGGLYKLPEQFEDMTETQLMEAILSDFNSNPGRTEVVVEYVDENDKLVRYPISQAGRRDGDPTLVLRLE